MTKHHMLKTSHVTIHPKRHMLCNVLVADSLPYSRQRDSLDIDLDVQAGGEEEPVGADLVEPGGALLSLLVGGRRIEPEFLNL